MACGCNNSFYNFPCCCPQAPAGTTTTTTTTLCPDAIPCEEAYKSDCIIYNGPDLACYGIRTGDSVTNIINIIIAQLDPCTTTTTSTTTACVRPSALNTYVLNTSINNVSFNASLEAACDAYNQYAANPSGTNLSGITGQGSSLSYGSVIYNGISTDCSLIPNGYYIIAGQAGVVTMINGVVTTLTTCPTTTTTSTSSTTTSTTASPFGPYVCECISYFIENNSGDTVVIPFTDCITGQPDPDGITLLNGDITNFCACLDSIPQITGVAITQAGPCGPPVTTSTSTTTSTTTTAAPYTPTGLFRYENNTAGGVTQLLSLGSSTPGFTDGYAISSGSLPVGAGQSIIGTHHLVNQGALFNIWTTEAGSISIYRNNILILCTNVSNNGGTTSNSISCPQTIPQSDDLVIIYSNTSCSTITTTTTTTVEPTTSTTSTTTTTTADPSITTTTSTTTTTTSTTLNPNTTVITIANRDISFGMEILAINDLGTGLLIPLDSGSYPILADQEFTITLPNGVYDFDVYVSPYDNRGSITLVDSNGTLDCRATDIPGNYIFSSVYVDAAGGTSPSTITLVDTAC